MALAISFMEPSGSTGNSGAFRLLPGPQQVEWLSGPGLTSAHALRGLSLTGAAKKPVLRGLLQQLAASGKAAKGPLTLRIAQHLPLPASPEAYVEGKFTCFRRYPDKKCLTFRHKVYQAKGYL